MAFWKTVGSLYRSLQLTRNTPDYTKILLSRALHSVKGKCFIVSVGKSRCIEERSKTKRINWLAKIEHLWGFLAENLFVFQPLWWCNLQSERTAVTWKIWYLFCQVLPASSKAVVLPCTVAAAVSWAVSSANTWFPFCVCSYMTPSSETQSSELQDCQIVPAGTGSTRARELTQATQGSCVGTTWAATLRATGWGHRVHPCRAGSCHTGLFQQDRHLSMPHMGMPLRGMLALEFHLR